MNRAISIATAPLRFGATALAAVGRATAMVFGRSGGWIMLQARTRINYRAEIGDPATNSIVGAVVGWIARNFPEAPVRIIREGASLDEPGIPPAATGPGAMLRLLERPNPFYSGVLQWQATIVDYVLRSDAYWYKERNQASRRVVRLWWIPERMIEPHWPREDPSVFIDYYEYRVDGQTYRIGPADIVHFRNGIDPANPRKGLSRLSSLFREIFTDDEASNFTASLLRNLGVPGVILAPSNTTGGRPVTIDAEQVKNDYMEKFGGDRRGEPLILTGPTDIKVLSWSPEQMNLRELRRIPEERVSAVLGVPAGVAGLGAGLDRNTFSNYGEANAAAYTQGVIPLQRLLAAELEVQLLDDFTDIATAGLDVVFDWRFVSAFAAVLADTWRRHESAASKGLLTRAAFKHAIGKPVAADGSDEVYVIPNNYLVMPAGGRSGPPPSGLPAPTGAARVEPVAVAPANGNGHVASELAGALP